MHDLFSTIMFKFLSTNYVAASPLPSKVLEINLSFCNIAHGWVEDSKC